VTTVAAAALRRPRGRVPRAVVLAIAAAWALALVAELTGTGGRLHHDSLLEGGPPLWVALPLFLLAWQVMVAAMMLPSSLPLLRLFDAVTRRRDAQEHTRVAFVGGYVAVWAAFGAFAFLGDSVVHHVVDATPALSERPWLVAGGVLALAGAFQFSDLKDRCLSKCRHPGPYLLAHYRRGASGAFWLGFGHGVFCLGCCWALMLLMFAVGVAHVAWMAALAALMVYEKTGRHGYRVARVAGVVLLVWAAVVLVHPGWLPPALSLAAPHHHGH
jgi:predicted metal-binding membrane protein